MKLKLVASVKYFSTKHRDTPQYPYFQMPSDKRFGLETLLQPQLLVQVRLKLVVAVHTDEYFSAKQSHTLISIFPSDLPCLPAALIVYVVRLEISIVVYTNGYSSSTQRHTPEFIFPNISSKKLAWEPSSSFNLCSQTKTPSFY